MAPLTRNIVVNNNEAVTRQYVDTAMAKIREMITTLGMQHNEMANQDPMSALKNAMYKKSAREYQDPFDTLLCRVNISEENAVCMYLGGLPTKLEMSVRMFRPKTLTEAYRLTNLQEGTLEAVKKKDKLVVTYNVGRYVSGMSYGSNVRPPLFALPTPNTG
ncbi:hypothetical protein Tco_1269501 [Tanacetum coccineum]